MSGVHGMQMAAFFNADTDLGRAPEVAIDTRCVGELGIELPIFMSEPLEATR